MSYYFLHLFCLDPDKTGEPGELVLGPFEGLAMTWGYFRGWPTEEDAGAPDDHIVGVQEDVLRLPGHDASFYSDLAIYTSESPHRADLPDLLHELPLYPHPSRIGTCGACGHELGLHDGWPAKSSIADWHSSLPDTPCDECSCTWAEEPIR